MDEQKDFLKDVIFSKPCKHLVLELGKALHRETRIDSV